MEIQVIADHKQVSRWVRRAEKKSGDISWVDGKWLVWKAEGKNRLAMGLRGTEEHIVTQSQACKTALDIPTFTLISGCKTLHHSSSSFLFN